MTTQGRGGRVGEQEHDDRYVPRRSILLALATGVAGVLAGSPFARAHAHGHPRVSGTAVDAAAAAALPPIPPPHPGRPEVFYAPPARGRGVALTVDDGYDAPTVAAYVQFAADSGIPISFNPNGVYAREWNSHAAVLRPLIARGQAQIGNHTYSHHSIVRMSRERLEREIVRNEQWIESTFGTTSRPFFRPPFGFRNAVTDEIVGSLGYTKILMWNGSFGDSDLLTPDVLMAQARRYLQPGTILLAHANHRTVTRLYDQIVSLIRDRNLDMQTLDQMFGTSRRIG